MLTKSPSDLTFALSHAVAAAVVRDADDRPPSAIANGGERAENSFVYCMTSAIVGEAPVVGKLPVQPWHNFNVAATFEHTSRGSGKQDRAVVSQHQGPLPGVGNPNRHKRIVNGLPLPAAIAPWPDSTRTLQAAEQDGQAPHFQATQIASDLFRV